MRRAVLATLGAGLANFPSPFLIGGSPARYGVRWQGNGFGAL